MNNCLIKSIVLYIIISFALYTFKPSIFYYDSDKTKLKEWNIYNDTQDINDLITLPSIIIISGLLCFFIGNSM